MGAAASWSTPAASVQSAVPQQSQDFFSLADAAPIPQSRAVDLLGNSFGADPVTAPVVQSPVVQSPMGSGSFWDEGAAVAQQAPVQQQQPEMDLFASIPVQSPVPVQNVNSGPPPGSQFDLLGSMNPMNVISPVSTPAASTPQAAMSPAGPPKEVGSTWQGENKGKVNIDLTMLGRPQQQKKSISMNQQRNSSQSSNVTSPVGQQQFSPQMSPQMAFQNQQMRMPQQQMGGFPQQQMGGFQQQQMGGFPQQQMGGFPQQQMGGFQQQQMGGFPPQGQQMGQQANPMGNFQAQPNQMNPQMNQMTQQMGQMGFLPNQNKNNNLGNLL